MNFYDSYNEPTELAPREGMYLETKVVGENESRRCLTTPLLEIVKAVADAFSLYEKAWVAEGTPFSSRGAQVRDLLIERAKDLDLDEKLPALFSYSTLGINNRISGYTVVDTGGAVRNLKWVAALAELVTDVGGDVREVSTTDIEYEMTLGQAFEVSRHEKWVWQSDELFDGITSDIASRLIGLGHGYAPEVLTKKHPLVVRVQALWDEYNATRKSNKKVTDGL